MEKKKILLFADWYEPGYKAGGPIRSCVNFVWHMKQDYRIYVFTTDRDLGSDRPYEGVEADKWVGTEEGVELFYCSPGQLSGGNIRSQIKRIAPDFVYLNSMFSTFFTIIPLLAGFGRRTPYEIILSPRGMLRDSAVQFKAAKKKIFLLFFRLLRLPRRIRFLASDATEQSDIRRRFGTRVSISQIPNLPGVLPAYPGAAEKKQGELLLIFIGRIHPIKNLDYLLGLLAVPGVSLRLSVVGSIEDKAYWEQCKEQIKRLPAHVAVDYLGEMANHRLPAVIARHHVFVLPTKGENFGHAIFEALSLGRPVLISDQTPWRGLQEAGAGWDIALDDPAGFQNALLQAGNWGQEEYSDHSKAAFELARRRIDPGHVLDQYRKLFS